jgi:hypothetical protein
MKRTWIKLLLSMVAGLVTAQAATISGTVSNAGSTPLAGIYIAFRTTTTATGTTLVRDTTDSIGSYSVTCDSTSGTYVVRSTDPKGVYTMKYDTVVLDGTDKTVNVQMAAIQYTSVSGTVKDSATSSSIAGAIVRLSMRTDTTDSAGKYSFDSVATGTNTVSVTAIGYVGKSSSITLSGTDPRTVDFNLITIQYSSVSGTVKDSATGSAIVGAIVRLSTRRDTTDSAGAYSFDSVVTGAISVIATATGYVSKTVQDTLTATAKTLDVALALIQYSSVSGTVKDSATGNAIAGAIVSLGTGMASKRDTTDADGKYSLDSVATGVYTINISATYYVTRSIADTVPATAQTLDVLLKPAILGSVSGTVKDSATGSAIAGAIVSIGTGMGAASSIDTADADGKYLLEKITTRTTAYTLNVSAAGYASRSDTVTISDTTPKTREFLLVKIIYFPISGIVKDSTTGTPIAGAIVLLRTAMRDTIDLAVTDSTGKYTVDSAYTGTTLKVSADGYTLKRVETITGTATDAQTINFDLLAAIGIRTVFTLQNRQNIVIAGGKLVLKNFSEAGTIRLFNLKGELVFARSFAPCVASSIQLDKALSRGSYLIKIAQKKSVLYRKAVIR